MKCLGQEQKVYIQVYYVLYQIWGFRCGVE